MIWLNGVTPDAIAVLESMPSLVAVGGAPKDLSMPWANLRTDEPARAEWFGAIRG
jgi:hypothetical protein